VDKSTGEGIAHIQMTDFRSLRIQLPLPEVYQYVINTDADGPKQKKSRNEPQYARWKQPVAPPSMPVNGLKLEQYIERIDRECHGKPFKPGTRVWCNLGTLHGQWPAIIWAIRYCRKDELADALLTYRSGRYLVTFYGEHSLMWVRSEQVCLATNKIDRDLKDVLESWGRKHKQTSLVRLALMETATIEEDYDAEINRVRSLYDMHTVANRRHKNICHSCADPDAPLKCFGCDRRFHSLCLPVPSLTCKYLPENQWRCPCCDTGHNYKQEELSSNEEVNIDHADKMGLTPDWIISAAAFDVFGLDRPTVSSPTIMGLLDPCTNSKIAPNIPAEKLYDKVDNGLKLTNHWAGYYIILNPDFSSQIQWRFVNRAIDEVENESVPAVILICRNSTDTAFYQRLRPYPRVHLKRLSVLFKDYSNTPIGFGISIFCLAKKEKKNLYPRFYKAFENHGEPNLPVDSVFVQTDAFWSLLDRLGDFAGSHHRDHWIKCCQCAKWRIVSLDTVKTIASNEAWDCTMLHPPHSSCDTPLTKMEYVGGHYVAKEEDDEYDPEFKTYDAKSSPDAPQVMAGPLIQSNFDCIIDEIQKKGTHTMPQERVMSDGNIDLKSLTALELARKARMAANRAYLAELGDDCANNNVGLVAEAARRLAKHVAKQTCSTEIEKAKILYQKVNLVASKEEAPLQRELEKIQTARDQAKNNLDAAIAAAEMVENYINHQHGYQE
jgi:hypothetical protein